jgi:signal transduction histidine kinase
VPEKIPPEVSTVVHRITQEVLRNVAKHAGKTQPSNEQTTAN